MTRRHRRRPERVAGDGGETDETPRWTREQARLLERTDDTTAPIVYPPAAKLDPGHHVWDTWLVRERDGSLADVAGYRVIVALTADSELLPGKRHDAATLRFYYSRDGRNWQLGGRLFPDSTALGSRQWAGSALLDDGDLYCFYTGAGDRDETDLSYTQHLVVAEGGRLVADDSGGGLRIEGTFDHHSLLRPDGEWYEREEQSRGMIYTFRDPWFFEDPATGETYLLFEANTPVPEGSSLCGGDAAQQEFNGSVGLARSPTGDPTDFELRPPLLDGVCVNQELERPHVVVRDDRYYLFVSSHMHTFAPGLDGFDALYGFVADSLRGDYRPLNDSGLVATNPANAPFQAYSWLAYPHCEEVLVTSFVNYTEFDRPSLDDVAFLPESEQYRRFGGTLAPTIRLRLDGDRTRIVGTLDHGHLPTAAEALPETDDERIERLRRERGDDDRGY
jgi:levansucrase